jgi:hypothetical protein
MAEHALIDAVARRDTQAARKLISAGFDVDLRDPDQGWSALNHAAGKGQLDMITLLVEAGADIVSTGRDNRTPYDIAIAAGHVTAARYLASRMQALGIETRQRAYCRAYRMGDLQAFDQLSGVALTMSAETVAFLHHDHTVTESMFHGQNVIAIDVTPAWRAFCKQTLGFDVPDDFEIVPAARLQAPQNESVFD